MFNIRNLSKENRRGVSISPNGLTDWSAPALDQTLIEPICMAGIVRRPADDQHPSLILFSNPNNLDRPDGKESPGGHRDRKNLTIRLSRDDGRIWTADRVLEPGFAAYSDLAVLPSGEVLCFYERGGDPNANPPQRSSYARLTLARFPVEWVTYTGD